MKNIKYTVSRFISENIIVDGFPTPEEIKTGGKHDDCKVIINVSDEFYLGNSEEIIKEGKLNYYFPMGEMGESMGLNSICGALQVLHGIYTWNPEWKVLYNPSNKTHKSLACVMNLTKSNSNLE